MHPAENRSPRLQTRLKTQSPESLYQLRPGGDDMHRDIPGGIGTGNAARGLMITDQDHQVIAGARLLEIAGEPGIGVLDRPQVFR